MTATNLYEQDVVAWTERQAHELRALRTSRGNGPLDLQLLAEEIEASGRNERHRRLSTTIRHHLTTKLETYY